MLAAIGSALRRFFRLSAPPPALAAAAPSAGAPAAPVDSGQAGASEPHYRGGQIEWTPSLLKQALRRTDATGALDFVAQLCDDLLGDDRIQSAFGTRVGGLLGSPLGFEAAALTGTARRRKRALRALEAGEDWWELFPEEELSKLIIWGLLLGVGFARLRWTQSDDHGGRALTRIEVWHPRWFKWDHAAKAWLQWDGKRWNRITAGDGEWVIFTPYGRNRPWAFGLWRGLSMLWLLKHLAQKDWCLQSELQGIPGWVITGEQNHQKRKELAQLFGDLARNPAVALPPGVDAKLVEAEANTWETFEHQIQMADRGFAVSIVGGNLNVEVSGNQQTGSTAQTLVRIDYKRRDANTVSTMAHDQVLTWWAEWNFSEKGAAPWPLWNVEPPSNTSQVATTWLTVSKALDGFRKAGLVVDLRVTAERFGIPIVGQAEPDAEDEDAPEAKEDDDVAEEDAEVEDPGDDDANEKDAAE